MQASQVSVRPLCRRPASAVIVIERPAKKARITIHSARPGCGDRQERRRHREASLGCRAHDPERTSISTSSRSASPSSMPGSSPTISRSSSSDSVAFRRAMKRAVQSAMRLGAEGIRINCGGRLGVARRSPAYGVVPRGSRAAAHAAGRRRLWHVATAHTTYGTCGVKVWVFKGEILAHDPMAQDKRQPGTTGRTVTAHEAARTGNTTMLSPEAHQISGKPTRAASTAMPRQAPSLNFGAFGLKATSSPAG